MFFSNLFHLAKYPLLHPRGCKISSTTRMLNEVWFNPPQPPIKMDNRAIDNMRFRLTDGEM